MPRRSTFWRFILATLVMSAVTAVGAVAVSIWVGKELVYDIQEQASYTLLRNTNDLIARSSMSMEAAYNLELRNARALLDLTNRHALAELQTYHTLASDGILSHEQARNKALARISELSTLSPVPAQVLDHSLRVVANRDSKRRGRDLSDFRDREGFAFHKRLTAKAQKLKGRKSAYSIAYPATSDPAGILISALHFPPWDMYVSSQMLLAPMYKTLEELHRSALNELKARVREIVIGKAGYVFIADSDCNVLAHPTMEGLNLKQYMLDRGDTSMCAKLYAMAPRKWGSNKFHYQWNRPDDFEKNTHEKMMWVTREPTTGWFVGVTAYMNEIEDSIPRFFRAIFLPSVMSIVILGGAMALILRGFLKPVEELTQVCRSVAQGDLANRARPDAPGEIGFLCRRFNDMIQSIEDLREVDSRRRRELEVLNTDLERIVGLRTRALERKARKLEEVNTRLQELDRMKSAFLSSVSHELRTPLTSIMGFAKLISKDFRSTFFGEEDQKCLAPGCLRKARRIDENLNVISLEGERLTRLINDVLDLAKIESGRMDWRDEEFSVKEVVEQVAANMRASVRRSPEVDIVVNVSDGLPLLRADRDRISQVFINLMDNALKFTDTGRLTVFVCESEGWMQASISDTGEGIHQHELMMVFDKFHQALGGDTLLQKPSGTGLGLAICNNILSRYGGFIWAESEFGKGTDIRFELPVDGAAIAEVERLKEAASHDDGPLVLVVDDEESIRSLLVDALRNDGYRVVTAPDGFMALELAEEMQPDLITLDLLMPGLDGQETIAQLRSRPNLSDVPIVVISILGDDDVSGADALFEKPIDEAALLETIRQLMVRRIQAKRQQAFSCMLPVSGDMHQVEELEEILNKGFDGVMVLPENIAKELDLKALARNTGAKVLASPDEKTIDEEAEATDDQEQDTS